MNKYVVKLEENKSIRFEIPESFKCFIIIANNLDEATKKAKNRIKFLVKGEEVICDVGYYSSCFTTVNHIDKMDLRFKLCLASYIIKSNIT